MSLTSASADPSDVRRRPSSLRFHPQEMANLLWRYATLGHYPGDQLQEAMALHMVDRIQAYRPQAVSNSLWAYSKVSIRALASA